jgi:nucleoside-diphosphate-sugar epimerase
MVTGATGFIGSHVVHQLIGKGHHVHALIRSPQKADNLREWGTSLFMGDITDRNSIRRAMKGVDGVFHLAAWYQLGIRDWKKAELINVAGTRNVLELMHELEIKKGVYTSSLAVFSDTKGEMVDESYMFTGKHLSVYDRTKWEAHYHVAQPMIDEGLPLVIVLPGLVYGPGDPSFVGDLLRSYLDGKLNKLPRGTALCWAHVDDIAGGHILAMEKGVAGQSYIIAGFPHTFDEVFAIAEEITGKPAPKKLTSPATMKFFSGVMKVLEVFIKPPPHYSSEGLRVGAGVTYLARNDKARRDLGYEVQSLREGLGETLQEMMRERKLTT